MRNDLNFWALKLLYHHTIVLQRDIALTRISFHATCLIMIPLLALSMPGWPEILVIFLIVLLLFGAKRLPELARGLGQSLSEFRKAKDEFDKELKKSANDLQIKEPLEKQPYTAGKSQAEEGARPRDTAT